MGNGKWVTGNGKRKTDNGEHTPYPTYRIPPFKLITLIVAIAFTTTTIAWSTPVEYLRQQSALERQYYRITFAPVQVEPDFTRYEVGLEVKDILGPRRAKGWAVIIRPRKQRSLDLDVWVDEDIREYDFSKYAITEKIAKEKGRKHRPLPGFTTSEFMQRAPIMDREKIIFAAPATQGGYWIGTTLVIKDGRLITKPVPGLHQESVEPLNGPHYFLVLDAKDPAKIGMKVINFKDVDPRKELPEEIKKEIEGIGLTIAGPPLIQDNVDVSRRIRFAGKGKHPAAGNEVTWDPETTKTAFAGLGLTKEGNIVYLAMVGVSETDPGVFIGDLPKIMARPELGVMAAITGPGSADVPGNVYVKGEQDMLSSNAGFAHSKTAQRGRPRPLATILFVKRKGQVPTDNILEKFYGMEKRFVKEHVRRVTKLALLIATHLKVPERDLELLTYAAPLHDIAFLNEETQKIWRATANKYGISRPVSEFRENPESFYAAYSGPFLRSLRNKYADGIPLEEIAKNIYRIVAEKLKNSCTPQELEALGPPEELLKKAFNHEENAIEVLKGILPEELAKLGIQQDLLREIYPIIQYHSRPSRMPEDTPANIKFLTQILAAADVIEASNNRYRGRVMYNRSAYADENWEKTFGNLIQKLKMGDITHKIFDAVHELVNNQNPEMISTVQRARMDDEWEWTVGKHQYNQNILLEQAV